jgi:hypothetical protein
MVALNTAYAAPKNAADPKNRVGDFFHEDSASVGKNRWVKCLNAQEKSSYHYETASGRSNWPNRDPIGEAGGINIYGMINNLVVNAVDIDGRAVFPGWVIDTIDALGDFLDPNGQEGNICMPPDYDTDYVYGSCAAVCKNCKGITQRSNGQYEVKRELKCVNYQWNVISKSKHTDCNATCDSFSATDDTFTLAKHEYYSH